MLDLNFKEISLDDKDLLDDYFKKYQPVISEYTFNNLYTWKEYRNIEYAVNSNILYLKAKVKDKHYFLQPVGMDNPEKQIPELIEYSIKNKITGSIKRIDESTIGTLKNLNLQITEDKNSFDYLYTTEDLAFLKGRKLSNKRGFVKKFCSTYPHRYWLYDNNDECRKKCLEFTEKWFENWDNLSESLQHEYYAIKELLTNYDKYNVTGGVICIDNKIAAYAFGEKLNDNTFVIHFEKGDNDYSGIYQAINKFFSENEVYDNYDFINREQDLGVAGLRKAKESYYPLKLIKKYNITF